MGQQLPTRPADPWQELRKENWPLAVHLCEEILADDPSHVGALRALAIALLKQGHSIASVEILERATLTHSDDSLVWSDLGVLRYEDGDWPGAAEAFAVSIQLQPNNLTALHGRAEAFILMRRYSEARALLEKCVRLAPERTLFMTSLGYCLVGEGRWKEAEWITQECLRRDPHSPRALLLMASIYHHQFRLDLELELTEAAYRANPISFISRAQLALARWNCGDLEGALSAREQALLLKPTNRSLHASMAWLALHDPNQSSRSLRAVHRHTALAWRKASVPHPPHTNSPDPDRQLRIGYLSGEFVPNPAFCFLGSWLKHQDRTHFESFYYMSRPAREAEVQQFRPMADHWRDIWHLTDTEIASAIRKDAIDILVDLSGNFEDNRLSVFFERSAPVQVAYPHYPATTGIEDIDYIFTDIWTTPEGSEDGYAETPYRLPSGYIAYQLSFEPPPVGPLPALSNGPITFGLFQRPGKYHAEMWDAVAFILAQIPESRLLFHFASSDLDDENSAQRVKLSAPLQDRGIGPERLLFRGSRPLPQHLQVIAEVDIALDSFPYNGQTTTCDCLWMGVPVVNLRGSTHVSRVGQGLLERMDLGNLAACSIQDYVSTAVSLARDLNQLSQLRSELRARAIEHLGNGQRLSQEIEEGYRWMWKQWCHKNTGTQSVHSPKMVSH